MKYWDPVSGDEYYEEPQTEVRSFTFYVTAQITLEREVSIDGRGEMLEPYELNGTIRRLEDCVINAMKDEFEDGEDIKPYLTEWE